MSPEELQRDEPAVYHSTIVHHGTLRRAFKMLGIDYGFDEVADWKDKIRSFLGRLPDTVIARAAGVTARAIARERKKYHVPVCTKKTLIEEAEVAGMLD